MYLTEGKRRSLGPLTISGLIHAAGFVTGLCSLFGFFGTFSWWLDLFAHFRIQYTAIFLALSLLTLVLKRHPACWIYAGFLVLNLFQMMPFYVGKNSSEPEGKVYRLMLFNVLSSNDAYQATIDFIREKSPDLIVLLEVTPAWRKELGVLVEDWPYHRQEARNDNFGIGFYSRIEPESLEIVYFSYQGLPSIGAVVPLGDTDLTVLGAHPVPPLGDRWSRLQNDQLGAFAAYMNAQHGPKLLAGDLNNTPWASGFQRLVQETNLRNASQGRGIHASFPSRLGRFGMPIDHVLHSPEVVIHDKTIGPWLGSDHRAVVIDFSLATGR